MDSKLSSKQVDICTLKATCWLVLLTSRTEHELCFFNSTAKENQIISTKDEMLIFQKKPVRCLIKQEKEYGQRKSNNVRRKSETKI